MPNQIYAKVKMLDKSQKDRNKWPPAQTPQDARAPPKAFANQADASANGIAPNVAAGSVAEQALALLLEQMKGNGGGGGGTGGTKKKGPCHKCGKDGHWKNECPENKQRGSSKDYWRTKEPKSGEPTTITRNGTPYYWCAKCRRFQPTHSTETHVAGAGKGRNGRGNRNG